MVVAPEASGAYGKATADDILEGMGRVADWADQVREAMAGAAMLPHPPRAGASEMCREVVACYRPDGRCIDTLDAERTGWLYAQYAHTMQHRPHLAQQLGAGSFAEEVAKLLLRYKDGYRSTNGKVTTLRNHWANPNEFNKVLQAMHISKERFASPLNVATHVSSYWSLYEEDQIFGARCDAFSCQWRGASEANPEYTAHDMDKAMRYAVAAAIATTDPVLTVLVLPAWEGTAYRKWLQHPNVHLLATFDRNHYKFKAPDHWRGCRTYVGQPKWDVDMIIVANAAGVRKHLDEQRLRAALQEGAGALGEPRLDIAGAQNIVRAGQNAGTGSQLPLFKAPRAFARAPPEEETGVQCASSFTEYPNGEWYALRYDAQRIYYTDGSRVTSEGPNGCAMTTCGSGIFHPAHAMRAELDPAGVGPINTIQRAEAVPVWYILAGKHSDPYGVPDDESTLTIATDSLCTLRVIAKALYNPAELEDHKHRDIFLSMAEHIRRRAEAGQRIELLKVKSHTGVAGNEAADRLAVEASKKVAKGRLVEAVAERRSPPPGRRTWIQLAQGQAEEDTWRDAPSLNLPIDWRELRLGAANLQGPYAHSWQTHCAEHGCRDLNKALSDTVPYPALRAVLQCRGGQLVTQKLLHRWRRSKNSLCPLCGHEDSQTHLLLGCAAMKDHVIARHNEAVRTVVRHVLKGNKGGYSVVALDAADGGELLLQGIPKRVPEWLLPACPHRPDILLLEGASGDPKGWDTGTGLPSSLTAVHIVEVGYCMDTRHSEKRQEKLAQHAELVHKLEHRLRQAYGEEHPPVRMHALALGVTGFALDSNLKTLKDIGLDPSRARKCLKKICEMSMRKLHDIVVQRKQRTGYNSQGVT